VQTLAAKLSQGELASAVAAQKVADEDSSDVAPLGALRERLKIKLLYKETCRWKK
jgi:hypothetical protein